MKLITRDTDYAIRALCYMAGAKNEVVTVAELVRALKIPRPFLRKILQTLSIKGLLKSYKGRQGGFALAQKPGEIFLVDLMKIFQGPLCFNECLFKKKICPNVASCMLKQRISRIEQHMITELKPITIGSLL